MKLIISESEKQRILGMHNKVRNFLFEGEREDRVKQAVMKLMDASTSFGTDPQGIIDSLILLKDKEEFERFNYLISSRRYADEFLSFDDLIKKELESATDNFGYGGLIGYMGGDNEDDFKNIKNELNRLGVTYSGGIDDFTLTNVSNKPDELTDNPTTQPTPPPQPTQPPQPDPVKKPRIRK